MKKSLLALAVLGAFAGAAAAQTNVTLYGIMDVGVGMADPGGTADSTMVVDSGIQSTNRLGIRGSEDLGGGLKAIFNIETGIKPDRGDVSGATFWHRRAIAGLAGGWGEVRLGRDYTVGFTAAGVGDVMGYGLFGNWLAYTSGAGGVTTRAYNGIWYQSPSLGGVSVSAFYSTGTAGAPAAGQNEIADNPNDAYGLAATYTGGPLRAAAYYQELNDAAGNAAKEMGIGGQYSFGAFRLALNYGQQEAPVTGVDTTGIGIGAAMKLGTGEVLAQGIQIERDAAAGTDPKATVWGIAYVHPMSKRTNLYATFGTARNNSTGSFSILGADVSYAPTAVGDDPKAFAVGLRHMF